MACPSQTYTVEISRHKFLRRDATYSASVEINIGTVRYYRATVVTGWDDIPVEDWPDTPDVVEFDGMTESSGPASQISASIRVIGLYSGTFLLTTSGGEFAFKTLAGPPERECPNPATASDGSPLGWCYVGAFGGPSGAGEDGILQSYLFCLSTLNDQGICCGASVSPPDPEVPSEPPVDPEPPPPPIFPKPPGTPSTPRKNIMPIPGTSTVLTYDCPTTSTGPACASQTDATRNPLANTDANPAVSVRLEPSSVTTLAGRRAKIRVIATFEDGQEADVTTLCTFNSPNAAIAESLGLGFIAGRAAGAAFVEFSWGAFSGRVEVTVLAIGCVDDAPWDVVLVIDQSLGSSFFPYQDFEAWNSATSTSPIRQLYWHPTTQTSIDLFDEILAQAQSALSLRNSADTTDVGADRLAVVLTGDGDPLTATTWSNSASNLTFTGHFADVRLGQALQRAGTLLSSALEGSTKLVIVVSATGGNGCSPSALSAATTLKSGGALVAVVTPLAANATTYSACTYPQRAFAMMQSMSTSGLFYGGVSVSEMGNKLGEILADACAL